MKKLLSAIAVAATFLIGSMSGAMAACSGPAIMHDFANTAFNMSLITAQDGNCASNVGLNTSTAGALVAGVAVDGWNVTLGAKADAACGTAAGTCSQIALQKYLNTIAGNAVPATVNGTATGLTALTPGVAQTGTIIALNTDLSSIKGTATSVNSGTKDAGTLRTVTATDQLALAAWGHGATAATAPAGATQAGATAQNAEATAVTNGQLKALVTDLVGKLIVLPYANPENFLNGQITSAMTGTSDTAVTGMGAQGAGVRNYVTSCTFSNTHATVDTLMVLKDGSAGAVIWQAPAAHAAGGAVVNFPTPIKTTANTGLFAANITTGSNTFVSCTGFKGI